MNCDGVDVIRVYAATFRVLRDAPDDELASVALHYAHYNFVRVHRTLRCTPAMAAGVTDRLWSVEELISEPLAKGERAG